jgi:hypothetical protein
MVRWAQASWLVVGVLGLGGLAMAQEGLIVDPWTHPNALPRVQATAPAARTVLSSSRPARVVARKAAPSVVPVGPPLDVRTNEGAVVPLGSALHDDLVDPWASDSERATEAEHRARLTFAQRDWSWEVQEIIDPWAKGPVAVAIDPAIVDPWAR